MRKPLPPFVRYQLRRRASYTAGSRSRPLCDSVGFLDDAIAVTTDDESPDRLEAPDSGGRPKKARSRAPKDTGLLHAAPSTKYELQMHTNQADPEHVCVSIVASSELVAAVMQEDTAS